MPRASTSAAPAARHSSRILHPVLYDCVVPKDFMSRLACTRYHLVVCRTCMCGACRLLALSAHDIQALRFNDACRFQPRDQHRVEEERQSGPRDIRGVAQSERAPVGVIRFLLLPCFLLGIFNFPRPSTTKPMLARTKHFDNTLSCSPLLLQRTRWSTVRWQRAARRSAWACCGSASSCCCLLPCARSWRLCSGVEEGPVVKPPSAPYASKWGVQSAVQPDSPLMCAPPDSCVLLGVR